MLRKLALMVVIALPLAGYSGIGAFSGIAHAQPATVGQMCETSYPESGSPYQLYCPSFTEPSDFNPGGDIHNGGEGPYQDPSGVGVHWTGTSGSYAGFACAVPSIVNGDGYLTTTSSEMDFQISEATDTVWISEWCQVQTPDHPGSNLYAQLVDDSICWSQGLGGTGYADEADNNFYVAESPTGVATLHCNFDEPFVCGASNIKPSSLSLNLDVVKDAPVC